MASGSTSHQNQSRAGRETGGPGGREGEGNRESEGGRGAGGRESGVRVCVGGQVELESARGQPGRLGLGSPGDSD